MSSIIKHIEYYLPEKVITNDELAMNNPEWDIEKAASKSGVFKRHIAADDETALDLAIGAVKKLFLSNAIEKEEIDAIVFCTQSPDYIMPSNSFLIHRHFEFPENVWAFDLDLACSGFVYGLSIINGLLSTGLARNVLFITADTYSKYLHPKDRSTNILFGDGAAASVISKATDRGIVDVILETNGSKFDTFYIPAGGHRTPKSEKTKEPYTDQSGNIKCLENIHMNGFSVWQFVSKHVSDQVKRLIGRNNLTTDNIDLFVFHQASKMTIDSLNKILKIPIDKSYVNLSQIGNTVSSSIPIALKNAECEGRLKRGDLIVVSGFGVGLSWGSLLIKY